MKGKFSGYFDAKGDPQRLPNFECAFVKLAVLTVENDGDDTPVAPDGSGGYKTLQREIYWGFGQNPVIPLYPSETTELIPVSNLRDVFVRCNKNRASQRLYFTCFG